MNLQSISAAMADQYPSGSMIELDQKEQRLERFGRIAFGGFGVVVGIAIIGLIGTIISRMILTGSQFWVGVVLVAFIVFAALSLAYVFFNEDLKQKRKGLAKQRDTYPAPAPALDVDTNKLLDQPPARQVASVVDNTTELLPILIENSK
jgi:MFS family permease